MPSYPMLAQYLAVVPAGSGESGFAPQIIPYLTDIWLREYFARVRKCDVVEVPIDRFTYLFDIEPGRLIAAWGVSRGKHSAPRPASRMKGHPKGGGADTHRGHAIAHTLGGGTDINLVPQLGSVNVGAFRVLEKEAVATPGALYFTHFIYRGARDQRASWVEQGLLVPGRAPKVTLHGN
ncbi:MAG: hypothetical protein KC591_06660 [Gemmatimonadetes bacterium]|nr:hypothetical protein [Gemmatimonadota bacterium]